jgi:hypothetical protein
LKHSLEGTMRAAVRVSEVDSRENVNEDEKEVRRKLFCCGTAESKSCGYRRAAKENQCWISKDIVPICHGMQGT